MTLEKSNDQSNGEQDQQEENSVFDFLYYDVSRIASFLSQFDDSGHMTELRRSESAVSKSQKAGTMEFKASILAASGGGKDELRTEKSAERLNQRSYDPRWVNALSFLDYADQAQLLNRDIETSSIGQLVLFKGELSLFDMGLLKNVWSMPTAKKHMIAGAGQTDQSGSTASLNRRERRKSSATAKNDAASEAALGLELMSVLPHSVQVAVSSDESSVWTTLREENLTVSPSDLFMKHGMCIDGEWAIVGILDAHPDYDLEGLEAGGVPLKQAKQMLAAMRLGGFAALIGTQFTDVVRQLLGRPAQSYGFTPLLIFRELQH
ncbi:DUF6414 family protein [Agrobacterium pusense]|uniref:DUF6414 family protein n=1 Tax=Agrobacterium pusense TaxID=648995 RepID=UPI0013AF463C